MYSLSYVSFCNLHLHGKSLNSLGKLLLLLLLWLRKTINVLMFTFRRMPGKMFSNL